MARTPVRRLIQPRRTKLKPPPVTPAFRKECHDTLDTFLDISPGTDSIGFIIDGLSGCKMVSLPKSLSVKKGLLNEVYDSVIGVEK